MTEGVLQLKRRRLGDFSGLQARYQPEFAENDALLRLDDRLFNGVMISPHAPLLPPHTLGDPVEEWPKIQILVNRQNPKSRKVPLVFLMEGDSALGNCRPEERRNRSKIDTLRAGKYPIEFGRKCQEFIEGESGTRLHPQIPVAVRTSPPLNT